jgi:hypothetical protein
MPRQFMYTANLVDSRVLLYMVFGWRVSAVEVIAREVMRPRGLIGFTIDMIDYSGPEIATVSAFFVDGMICSRPLLTFPLQGS